MLRWLYSCVRDDTGRRLPEATGTRQWHKARPDASARAAVRRRLRADPEFAVFGPHMRRMLLAGLAVVVVATAGEWIPEWLPVASLVRILLLVALNVFFLWTMLPLFWRYGRRRTLLCGHCPACGYDLGGIGMEGIDLTRCPECSAQWRSSEIGLR